MSSNALRRSRRVQGLAPEADGLGLCLICQGDFNVEELQRLHRAVCCGSLFHRRCYQQIIARTSRCVACRHEREPENPRALESPEDDLELLVGDLEEEEPIRIAILRTGTFGINRFQALVLEDMNNYCRVGLPCPRRPG